ncbi:LysR substrate-binding domain-containing protein [Pseudoalteromonas sp.]|uniref:LysR substrate-binding domain-containing protein n=1 Tax=Pseudoalteromonas sp. TaxID=53249 RepID=UPI00356878B3
MINSDDLHFFSVIATQNSLAAAARFLNVTPPTVTQRLQLIESKLNIKLVERHARKIALTDEGKMLAQRAKIVLAEITDLHEALSLHQTEMSGCLRVLSSISFGQQYVAPLISEFQTKHPKVTVELMLSDAPNYADGQHWDITVYIGELRDSSLKLTTLAKNQRLLCAAPSYIEKYGMPSTPQELRNHHCIVLRENAEDVSLWRFQHAKTKQDQAIRVIPRLASNDGRVTKQWALDGQGIIYRSEWDLAPDIAAGRLVKLLPDYTLQAAEIVALLGTEPSARSLRTKEFIALLKERIKLRPWLG